MPASPIAAAFPRFGDVAHLGHLELFTPKPEASLAFFTSVVGLHETGRSGDSVYLRAWGDYERHTLKLTAHITSGLGHLGLRVRDEPTLQAFVARLSDHQIEGCWHGSDRVYEQAGVSGHSRIRHYGRPGETEDFWTGRAVQKVRQGARVKGNGLVKTVEQSPASDVNVLGAESVGERAPGSQLALLRHLRPVA